MPFLPSLSSRPSPSLFPRDSLPSHPFRPYRLLSFPPPLAPSPRGYPRPLVFPTLSTLLHLLLVITTNLSRINSPSGINSSKVQAWRRRKKLSRGGEGFVGESSPQFEPLLPLSEGEMENRNRERIIWIDAKFLKFTYALSCNLESWLDSFGSDFRNIDNLIINKFSFSTCEKKSESFIRESASGSF